MDSTLIMNQRSLMHGGQDSARVSLEAGILNDYSPLGFDAGDDNLYRYVGNDPTNETDPTGLQARAELSDDRRELQNQRESRMPSPDIDISKSTTIPSSRSQYTSYYTTQASTTINDSVLGIAHNVTINFNTKTSEFGGGFAMRRTLYQSPSWTETQRQQVKQAVQGAIQKIEKAFAVLSDPTLTQTFIQENPVGMFSKKLKDPMFVRNMLQYLVNVKNGLENNGQINIFIDDKYMSPTSPSLKMDLTTPGGLKRLIWSPYYASYEHIHVNKSFFGLPPDQQARDMAHELGRYFGGIAAEGNYGDDMANFDDTLRLLESTYNRLHVMSSQK